MTERPQFSLASATEPPADADLASAIPGVLELVRLVDATSVTRVRLGVGNIRVDIEAAPPGCGMPAVGGARSGPGQAGRAGPSQPSAAPPSSAAMVRAMLVGVFYRGPEPNAEPFVEIGTTVEAGQQLAIVEAMKMMNPVVADRAGVVGEILADDGKVVEFDQPLFAIEPR